jgi:hypothetical protein
MDLIGKNFSDIIQIYNVYDEKNKKKEKKLKNWVLLGQNLMLMNPAKPFDSYRWL